MKMEGTALYENWRKEKKGVRDEERLSSVTFYLALHLSCVA